ncbi:MAG: N-acetyl-gamma-glutamyl-phosphate reductase [Clostridia bacterium]
MFNVFIDGSSGTTGLRIYDRLKKRNDINIISLEKDMMKDPVRKKECLNSCDYAVLCLPDAAAVESVGMIENPDVKVIDTSTAHRTEKGWVYGFPELSEETYEKLKTTKRVAVAGCHASGFISLVYPLVESGILPNDYPFTCCSLTGYSGGGKTMISEYTDSDRNAGYDSPGIYALSQEHKHLKEMTAISKLKNMPVFVPVVSDFYSGMAVTVPIITDLVEHTGSLKTAIADIYADKYGKHPLMDVKDIYGSDLNGFIYSNSMAGRDSMKIYVMGNEDRLLLVSVFDNLGKGASGSAIQCMNIMMGLDETEGLNI